MPPPREKNETVPRARALRRNPTLPEGLLWQILRKRPGGLKFRRQHPIGQFIVDFYCAAARLVIEIDGMSHDLGNNPERDKHRDEWLQSQGLCVVRFRAVETLKDVNEVADAIVTAARQQLPLHHLATLVGSPPQAVGPGRN